MKPETREELRKALLHGVDVRALLDRMTKHRNTVGGFRARANLRRTAAQRSADWLTRQVASIPFLVAHLVLFVIWFALNLYVLSSRQAFDAYPFSLLTMILTVEQSVLTILIIFSQNRSEKLTILRGELNLQTNLLAEEEVSKALHVLRLIGQKLDIQETMNDSELRVMETSLDFEAMEQETLQEVDDDT